MPRNWKTVLSIFSWEKENQNKTQTVYFPGTSWIVCMHVVIPLIMQKSLPVYKSCSHTSEYSLSINCRLMVYFLLLSGVRWDNEYPVKIVVTFSQLGGKSLEMFMNTSETPLELFKVTFFFWLNTEMWIAWWESESSYKKWRTYPEKLILFQNIMETPWFETNVYH